MEIEACITFDQASINFCGNHTIIVVACGTQTHAFVGSERVSGGCKHIKKYFIVRLFRTN